MALDIRQELKQIRTNAFIQRFGRCFFSDTFLYICNVFSFFSGTFLCLCFRRPGDERLLTLDRRPETFERRRITTRRWNDVGNDLDELEQLWTPGRNLLISSKLTKTTTTTIVRQQRSTPSRRNSSRLQPLR